MKHCVESECEPLQRPFFGGLGLRLRASYALAPLGYYHHGKGYDSFLRSIYRSGEFMSGRNFKRQFEQRIGQEVAAFEEVMKKLRIRE